MSDLKSKAPKLLTLQLCCFVWRLCSLLLLRAEHGGTICRTWTETRTINSLKESVETCNCCKPQGSTGFSVEVDAEKQKLENSVAVMPSNCNVERTRQVCHFLLLSFEITFTEINKDLELKAKLFV